MNRITAAIIVFGLIVLTSAAVILLGTDESPSSEDSMTALAVEHKDDSLDSRFVPIVAAPEATRIELESKGVAIDGVVIDAEDQPVPNAEVFMRTPESAGILARASADSNGQFKLFGIAPGTYHVDAIFKDRINSVPLQVVMTKESLRIVIQLDTGPILRGRVTDHLGNPLARVSLRLSSTDLSKDPISHRETTTDVSGHYMFPPIRTNAYTVSSHAEPFYAVDGNQTVLMQGDQRIDFVLTRLALVAGTVLGCDGLPSVGALVSFPAERQTTTSDQDGHFTFNKLRGGQQALELRALSEDLRSLATRELNVPPGGTLEDITIQLSPSPRIFGQVLSDLGQPIPNARVVAKRNAETMNLPYLSRGSSQTDTQRRLIELTQNLLIVGDSNKPLEVEAIRAKIVQAAMSHITQVAYEQSNMELAKTLSHLASKKPGSTTPSQKALEFLVDGSGNPSTTTDKEGHYEIVGLWPGSYDVSANADTYLRDDDGSQAAELSTVGQETRLDFLLYRGAVITGNVSLHDGTSVEDSLIRVFQEGSELNSVVTDESGAYRIDGLPSGALDLFAHLENSALVDSLTDFVVQRGGLYEGINFQLLEGGSIQGLVKDENGLPIAFAEVVVRSNQGEVSRTTESNEDGFYSVDALYDGEFSFTAAAERHVTSEEIPFIARRSETTVLDIELVRHINIHGRVTRSSGIPSPETFVFFIRDQESQSMITDSEGQYVAESTEPAQFEVMVRTNDYAENARITVDATRNRGSLQQDIQLSKACRVSGRVIDDNGNGLSGMAVSAMTIPSDQGTRSATTDSEGDFVIENLYPGQTRVRIDVVGINGQDVERVLTLSPGEFAKDIVLKVTTKSE